MAEITTAVIGVGYLGRFHAQKYARLGDSRLLAVVDTRADKARAVAAETGTCAIQDYRELLGRVQAVSIATPTRYHCEIASAFIEHGAHVLVEKPMAATVAEADRLIARAAARHRILQVGHLERFNTAILNVDPILGQPVFIESHRLAPFKQRGTDVSVVLDLMIHDIDIILNIVRADVARIDASGMPVLSQAVDIANARLVFTNGCVANVTASRITPRSERKLRIFQHDAYISIDFQGHEVAVHRRRAQRSTADVPEIESERHYYEDRDALETQIQHFLEAIRGGSAPLVSGADGRRALQTAIAITELVAAPRTSAAGDP